MSPPEPLFYHVALPFLLLTPFSLLELEKGQEIDYLWMRFPSGALGMRQHSRRYSNQRSNIKWIAWALAAALFLFTVENIWVDPWLRNKSHRIPSFVPEALSGAWFVAFVMGSLALTLLVVCQILLIRDRLLSVWTKLGTGIAVLVVLLLSVQWLLITNGKPGVFEFRLSSKKHTVTLTWRASTSHVAGYNVYRSTTPADNFEKINSVVVQGVTFTDTAVENGVTYYYLTRAVDSHGMESVNSNVTTAAIP